MWHAPPREKVRSGLDRDVLLLGLDFQRSLGAPYFQKNLIACRIYEFSRRQGRRRRSVFGRSVFEHTTSRRSAESACFAAPIRSLLLAQFRRDAPKEYYKKFNESKYVVTWDNGSTTRFDDCRNKNDVYRYQGAEFLFIGLDELTHFTLKQWQVLTSRNRGP
jgi:hypothetical protein